MWVASLRMWLISLVITLFIYHTLQADPDTMNILIKGMSLQRHPQELEVCFTQWQDSVPPTKGTVFLTIAPDLMPQQESEESMYDATELVDSKLYCTGFSIKQDITILYGSVTYLIHVHGDPHSPDAAGKVTLTMLDTDCSGAVIAKKASMIRMECTEAPTVEQMIYVDDVPLKILDVIQESVTQENILDLTKVEEATPSVTYLLIDGGLSTVTDDAMIMKVCSVLNELPDHVMACIGFGTGVAATETGHTNDVSVDYSGSTLTLTTDGSDIGFEFDLLAVSGEDLIGLAVGSGHNGQCAIIDYNVSKDIQYLQMSYDTPDRAGYTFIYETVLGYDLFGHCLTGTNVLESGWKSQGNKSPYNVYMGTHEALNPITVHCEESTYCYGFFDAGTDLKATILTLYPKGSSPNTYIMSNEVPVSTENEGINIRTINLRWSSDGLHCQTSVCTDATTKDDASLTQYQILLMDSQGRYHHSQTASLNAQNNICFDAVSLGINNFNFEGNLTIVAMKRDVDGRSLLANGHANIFAIAPKLESVGRRSGKVIWNNPGGYTFSIKKPNQDAPLATNITCNTCAFHFTYSNKQDDLLIVETEDTPVKITASIGLGDSINLGMKDAI